MSTQCRANSPIPCATRKAAMEREDFRYLDGLGWVWWRALDVVKPWTRCPWCWGELPMPGPVSGPKPVESSPYLEGDGAE
jgi:hypothetical protein